MHREVKVKTLSIDKISIINSDLVSVNDIMMCLIGKKTNLAVVSDCQYE